MTDDTQRDLPPPPPAPKIERLQMATALHAVHPGDSVLITTGPDITTAQASDLHDTVARAIPADCTITILIGVTASAVPKGQPPFAIDPEKWRQQLATDPVLHALWKLYEHDVEQLRAERRIFRNALGAIWRIHRGVGVLQPNYLEQIRRVMNDAWTEMVKHHRPGDGDLVE